MLMMKQPTQFRTLLERGADDGGLCQAAVAAAEASRMQTNTERRARRRGARLVAGRI